jgi:NhaA family Na+:H+ antiporter
MTPFRDFARKEASGGLVLLVAAIVALVWANSPWATAYDEFWHMELEIGIGHQSISASLQHWINDGLMAIFFLLVGLEIKRELLVGELASVRRATLPIVAALGGALLPAAIFVAIVGGGEPGRGWGVPMATDIAFALGILALVGRGAPLGLRVFLTALAIADDLIAIGVIALFYSSELDVTALATAGVIIVALLTANRMGVRRPIVYAVLGIALWLAVYLSGVHATVAGVLLALTIPARTRIDATQFVKQAQTIIGGFDGRSGASSSESGGAAAPNASAESDGDDEGSGHAAVDKRHSALWELEDLSEQAQSPMLRIEHALQSWVAFLIVPLFALANAGVAISGDPLRAITEPVTLGIVLGLVVGKQVGITLAAYAVVRLGLASLPRGVGWRHIYGAAWLGGIGFTMSLFVAGLAYADAALITAAKLGILAASAVAGFGGMVVLRARW